MFEDLNLVELRELLRQLEIRQAETERSIREVADRIRASATTLDREETRYPVNRQPMLPQDAPRQSSYTAPLARVPPNRFFCRRRARDRPALIRHAYNEVLR